MIRVVKVGGSLLDWPDLRQSLNHWLTQQPPASNVLLCGGGSLVNSIRRLPDDVYTSDESAHWLCIDLLAVTARLLAVAMRLSMLETYDEIIEQLAGGRNSATVFEPRRFLREHERRLPGAPLPIGWHVTTDSIAGRLAQILAADELVLLKSADPTSPALAQLAADDYIDSHFPTLALGCTDVRIVNLRGDWQVASQPGLDCDSP